MLFKDVIGHQSIKVQLIKMVQENRLGHALLFLGKEGSGALPLALALGQYVVSIPLSPNDGCTTPNLFGDISTATNCIPNPDEIELRSSFQRANKCIHPDLHFSYPVIPKKPGDKPKSSDYINHWRKFVQEQPYGNVYDWLQSIGADNKQGNITAEECNSIIQQSHLKSFENGYKVFLFWMPEYLQKEGNKLLKLIEEPPTNTLFILVAENEASILPTIVSRCQLIKIPPLHPSDIASALIKKATLLTKEAQQIATLSQGNYREALQLLLQSTTDWQTLLREWLNAILKGGPIAKTKFVETITKEGRENQKQFIKYFNHVIAESIHLNIIGADYTIITPQEEDFIHRINKSITLTQQQAIIEELDKAAYYIERNANSKMLFQALSIKLMYIIQNNVTVSM